VCRGQGYGWGMDNEMNRRRDIKMLSRAIFLSFRSTRKLFIQKLIKNVFSSKIHDFS